MPEFSTLLTFLLALVVLEITPGPDMMLVMARGVGQGRRIAFLTVTGMVFVAGIVQVGLLVLGLATLIQAHPSSLQIIQWAGAAYLIYLGIKMILGSFGPHALASRQKKPVTSWIAVRDGTVNSLTNPKSLLFMFAFLPQFVSPEAGPAWSQLLILSILQKCAGIFSLGSVAFAAGSVGQMLHRNPKWLAWQERFTGSILFGLGIRLLLSDSPSPAKN